MRKHTSILIEFGLNPKFSCNRPDIAVVPKLWPAAPKGAAASSQGSCELLQFFTILSFSHNFISIRWCRYSTAVVHKVFRMAAPLLNPDFPKPHCVKCSLTLYHISTVRLLVTLRFFWSKMCVLFILPNDPCKRKSLAVAISQSALLKIWHREPWENLDLAKESSFEKVWEPLWYRFIFNIWLRFIFNDFITLCHHITLFTVIIVIAIEHLYSTTQRLLFLADFPYICKWWVENRLIVTKNLIVKINQRLID